jgi:multisubunit Na+/H+ antiporter MnhC subunit
MNTLGAVGCADSHVRVLRAIDAQVQRGEVCANGWSLVCESDAKIDRKGWAAFSRSQARVDDAADVCMLVLGYMPGFDEGMPVSGRHGAFWNCATKPWQGTYALLVRNKHAGKIADAVLPLDCHYDAALAFAAMAGRIPPIWLASVPIVVEDRERNRSTVQSNKLELKTRLPASDVACSALVITPYVIAMALLITVLCMCIAQAASKRKRQQTVNTPR